MAAEVITLRDCNDQGRQLPPPGMQQIASELGLQTLGSTPESFYIEGIDRRPRAPEDPEYGIAIPIMPSCDLSKISFNTINSHHANYPKNHPIMRTLGGRALRVARIQLVESDLHNSSAATAFHTLYGDGIHLPETENEQFGACGIQVAGYLTDFVVDTHSGLGEVRPMKPWEAKVLKRNITSQMVNNMSVKRFRDSVMPHSSLYDAKQRLQKDTEESALQKYVAFNYGTGVVEFFRQYVISQDPNSLNQKLMKQFIRQGHPEVGMQLLGQAAAAACERGTIKGEQFSVVYTRLWKEGRINQNLPPYASDFILRKVGSLAGRRALLPVFREQVALKLNQAA